MKKTYYQIPTTTVCFMESVSAICGTSVAAWPDGGGGNPDPE